MEYPGSWNLLTASLAVCDLDRLEAAWTFVTRQGLVRSEPGDGETFNRLVRRELDLGPITGPTVALRVATALRRVGIALPAGEVPDPYGKTAQARFKEFVATTMIVAPSPSEPRTRFGFRILAGVIAAFLLLVGLPAAILEALDGAWLGWLFALSCLLAGIGLAGGARTGKWIFSRRIQATND